MKRDSLLKFRRPGNGSDSELILDYTGSWVRVRVSHRLVGWSHQWPTHISIYSEFSFKVLVFLDDDDESAATVKLLRQ